MIPLIIIISLLCSAFFSGLEIAFISANKLHIELQNKQGGYIAKILSKFNNNESRFIGTLLVGNNIALVVYGIMMAKLLKPVIVDFLPSQINTEIPVLIIQTIISTLLILVTAEFIPKTVFRINPNLTLNFFAIPAIIAYYVFYIPVWLIIGFSEFLLKQLFNVQFDDNSAVFGRVDLDDYMQDFIDFKNVKVKECMIPRTEIEAIEITDTIENLRKQFIQTGYSKILVYNETIDDIIGFCHQSEIFKNPETIRNILLPIPYVSESMLANDLLTKFIQQRKSIAVVVDEFGGTSGVVTMEDVVEEIFGEIEDEHDDEGLIEKQITDDETVLENQKKIDYINENYEINIPDSDEYETLAGYIVFKHQNLPKAKDVLFINNFKITVLKVTKTRVDLVKIKVL